MKEITVREVRSVLTRLDKVLASEGELVITRYGKPIARLLPPKSSGPMPSRAEFRSTMPRLETGSETYIRQDREGR